MIHNFGLIISANGGKIYKGTREINQVYEHVCEQIPGSGSCLQITPLYQCRHQMLRLLRSVNFKTPFGKNRLDQNSNKKI